jgi:hypothetical protein
LERDHPDPLREDEHPHQEEKPEQDLHGAGAPDEEEDPIEDDGDEQDVQNIHQANGGERP